MPLPQFSFLPSVFASYRTPRLGILLFASLAASSHADIDAGGGVTSGGRVAIQSSIGSPVETSGATGGEYALKPGMVDVVFAFSATSNPDLNSNGLPDSWEQQYFSNQTLDPQADPDGDGASNLLEYLAGTDPTNPASHFLAVGSLSGSIYTLPIQTSVGRMYRVWVSKDLQSWQLQQSYTGDGSQKVFYFDETAVASGPLYSVRHPSKYFFRVEIALP